MVMVIGVMLRSGSLAESLVVTTVVLKHLATSIIDGIHPGHPPPQINGPGAKNQLRTNCVGKRNNSP